MGSDFVSSRFALEGRNFVVTGASSGLGRAMAGFLAEAGAGVVLVARRESELAAAAEAINAERRCAVYVGADLLDRDGLAGLAAECVSLSGGSVDGVVNAAGVNLREPVDEISHRSWDMTLDLNLSVPFFFSREFIPGMRERNYGRIINIASLQSERAFANGLPYGASKGGVCQLTRAMAEAWSRFGICANAIAPGFFPTELTAPVFEDQATRERAAAQTAIGRNGELEDLAGATIFFASPASAYITGQTLFVDGGFTAR
ncbi:MAG: SDR family oxidoreductase [Gammaproteobacteria bacterium]|jgi:NAD(P)-dependent dehydrogenase (short-subunit alcohol dehydrogenase family)